MDLSSLTTGTKDSIIALLVAMGYKPAEIAGIRSHTKAKLVQHVASRLAQMNNAIDAQAHEIMTLMHTNGMLNQRVRELETAPTLGGLVCVGWCVCLRVLSVVLFPVSRFPFAGSSLPERRCLDFVLRFWSVGPSLLLMFVFVAFSLVG